MTTGPLLPEAVLAARERLAAGRDKLRRQHENGSPGVQVCTLMTDLLDGVVLGLFQAAVAQEPAAGSDRLALVAHSGYGRREMAPFSDVDVMLLHDLSEERVLPLVRRFSQWLYDTGLDVGFASRPLGQVTPLAASDPTIFTSLAEGRLLAGSGELFARCEQRLAALARRQSGRLLRAVEDSRREERTKYGETVFLLEPNVKRSRGTLRDIQLIRWIGFCRYGQREPEALAEDGWLSREDFRKLRDAREYLLRLRNELHFHAGKASDLLDRAEQMRIAELWGVAGTEGLLPVEQFMRDYFHYTEDVRDIAGYFLEGARPWSLLKGLVEPLLSHQMEGDFRVGPTSVYATRRGLAKMTGNLAEILRLLDLANLQDKRIDHATWDAIRRAMTQRAPIDGDAPLAEDVAQQFLALLSQPMRLGELLRRLHSLRVLEQIVPGMSHARNLLQFNDYHKYTVDEHSLRCVEELARLQTDDGPAGEVYRQIRQKRTVHLAALLHDLGKGYVEDHSEVGKRLAEQAAARLRLSPRETETLVFLVHQHLRMSHLVQRTDINDPAVAVQFAFELGTLEKLQMLYVLTIADYAAVGPGVLNEWKLQLLTDLYNHTLHVLTSASPEIGSSERLEQRREEIHSAAAGRPEPDWWRRQIAALPPGCVFGGPPQQIVAELDRLRTLPRSEALAWGRYLPERRAVEYTVGTYEEITPGVFHKLTGALSSQRHQILSAEIHTLSEGMVLDRFFVQDEDFPGPPPPERIEQVSGALVQALHDASNQPPVFRQLWRDRTRNQSPLRNHLPTRVTIDNSSSERCTIVAVFAYDRIGLLYAIARALFELELSVSLARIGTHLDQVTDVFYVTDTRGRKIDDEGRLAVIRARLLEAIEPTTVPA